MSSLKLLLWILFCHCFFGANSQFTDKVWCFGDSAGLNFNNPGNVPVPFYGPHISKGSCVSVCDSSGKLLFYAYTRAGMIGNSTLVLDSTFNIMQNGDNIIGEGWYNELVIIPKPSSSNLFYLFSNKITIGSGLYYSVVDMNVNSGLGGVIQKNLLLSSEDYADAMIAIRHGNGRDWWLLLHKWFNSNSFHIYLVTPFGITLTNIQNIGLIYNIDSGDFAFNYQTNKFLSVIQTNKVQVLNFNRCDGLFSNAITIQNGGLNSPQTFGCSISPDGTKGYVSNSNNFSDSLKLFQYDLTAPNITASKQTIFSEHIPAAGGHHSIGPNGKIYISSIYIYGYPYADSIHNIYSDNLSVINYPDSLGPACDFQPFSVNLGGKRTYWGIPNNPDYTQGAWVGSVCDTITSINDPENSENILRIYPNPFEEQLNLQMTSYEQTEVFLFDLAGRVLLNQLFVGSIIINTELFSPGMYVYQVRAKTGILHTGKVIKQ